MDAYASAGGDLLKHTLLRFYVESRKKSILAFSVSGDEVITCTIDCDAEHMTVILS